MIVGVIVLCAVGIALAVIGLLIWKKEMISLLHSYHYDKVSKKNKKAFCTLSGIGLLLLGSSLLICAVFFAVTESVLSFTAVALGLAAGLSLLVIAVKRYNQG